MTWILLALFWLSFSMMVGALAERWGRSAMGWALIALVVTPILALAYLLVLGDANPTCPHCRNHIRPEARVCGHCTRDLAG